MGKIAIIRDEPAREYDCFFVDAITAIDRHDIQFVAIVAVLDTPGQDKELGITGYYGMKNLNDMQKAAELIREDAL